MNAFKFSVIALLFLPVFASAERIAFTLDQSIDAADLIATGELIDLRQIDKPAINKSVPSVPPDQSITVSIDSGKPIRWGARFKINTVLKGSTKHGSVIRVEGLEHRSSIDGPDDFNRLPKTGSIWFFKRGDRGIFTVVHGDTVMTDSDNIRTEIDFYLRSKKGLNDLFIATTPGKVRDAIRRGVDVNALDYFGQTALDRAIKQNRIEVVRALLNGGAKLDLTVINPLDIAIDLGRASIIELLTSRGAHANGLFLLSDKSLREYEYFLKLGADVNAGMRAGYSPISQILDQSPPDAKERIAWLLEHGALASLPNGSRTQPLIQAVHCNNGTDVADLLLHHGADIDARDERGWTALIAALSCMPSVEMIEWLVSRGAKANVPDSYGWTALYRYLNGSATMANIAVVRLLLKAGADPRVVVASQSKSAIDLANECSAWSENCRNIAKLLNEHR